MPVRHRFLRPVLGPPPRQDFLRQGYVVVPGPLTDDDLAALLDLLEAETVVPPGPLPPSGTQPV
jgi:hypothetical protein